MATKKTAAKTTKRRVSKAPIRRIHTFNFFIAFAAILGMIAGVLMVQTFYKVPHLEHRSIVNLGAFEYDFKGTKAIKRTDESAKSLRAFLTAEADASGCAMDGKTPGMYSVKAFTKNRTQVLIGFGCGQTGSPMFAVLKDKKWQALSPTNKFDVLTNVPECDYVKQYAISKQIAPVCYSVSDSTVSYKVR